MNDSCVGKQREGITLSCLSEFVSAVHCPQPPYLCRKMRSCSFNCVHKWQSCRRAKRRYYTVCHDSLGWHVPCPCHPCRPFSKICDEVRPNGSAETAQYRAFLPPPPPPAHYLAALAAPSPWITGMITNGRAERGMTLRDEAGGAGFQGPRRLGALKKGLAH